MKKLSETYDPNIKWVEDSGTHGWIYWPRLKLYHDLGLKDTQLEKWFDKFKYDDYVKHVITSKNEKDLYEQHPKSWKKVRDVLLNRPERRKGRTCYETARDLLMDGLITDIIFIGIKSLCPDLNINKNKQDENLSLVSKAGIEPDFNVNGYPLEMKITKDKEDDYGRSKWAGTFTIRPGELDRELFRYSKYNSHEYPLMFLRINHVDKLLAVIGYDKFRPSKTDKSYYAYYRPRQFSNNIKTFIKTIGEEIRKEIKDIEQWKKSQ